MTTNQQNNMFFKAANLIIENLDIFGQQPTMRILQQKKYTSGLGCFMTLIISTLTLTYLITQIVTLQEKSQPKLVISEERILDTTPFPLYNDNFTLVVSVASIYSQPIIGQLKYYNITINHCIRLRSINQTTNTAQVTENCTALPIAPCTKSDWDNDLQQTFFKTARLGAMLCIDRKALRQNPPAMQGQFSGSIYQYLTIFMNLCKNSSTYQGCAPQEEINTIMQAGHYVVYASDYLLQFNEPDEPYQQFINMDYSTFSLSSSKTLSWIYRIQETHTDDGTFISNDKLIQNLRKQTTREQTDFYNHEYLVCHYIQLDFIKTINQRSYIKMQTILSQVGGFWQILIVIVSTVLNPLVNGLMMIQLANELYRFNRTDKEKIDQNQIKVETLTMQQDSPFTRHFPLQQKEKLTQNAFESFSLLMGCHKKKMKIFEVAKIDILEKLDIAKIMQKIQEIDKLKYLLFSEEQLKLFDLLPKPLIIDDNLQTQLMINDDGNFFQLTGRKNSPLRSPIQKINDYILSFEQVSKQQSRVSVDEKLIQMMDKNILTIFEQHQMRQNLNSPNIKRLTEPVSIIDHEPQIQQLR